MKYASILTLLFLVSCASPGLPIEWPHTDIRANVLYDDVYQNGQFLQLDRSLKEGEQGWRMMRIDLPNTWKVRAVAVDVEGFVIRLIDGRVFAVSKDKLSELSYRILDGGRKTERQLHKLWSSYERNG